MTVFVLDEFAFTQPGKKTYPIRGFANFYVTAGDGMNCPGDVPSIGEQNRGSGGTS